MYEYKKSNQSIYIFLQAGTGAGAINITGVQIIYILHTDNENRKKKKTT
jgi:hypothetical protein